MTPYARSVSYYDDVILIREVLLIEAADQILVVNLRLLLGFRVLYNGLSWI